MAVNSFKKMRTESVIKRTDSGMQIRLSDIHVKPGFNKRDDDERTRQADDELFTFLMAGGIVPALEVQARDEGGVWVIEGHRRQRVYLRCVEAGKPIEWISITPFTGNDVERLARIMTSNNQLPLTQLEQAAVVKELAAFNLTPDEIAKIINKSRATVDKLLILSRSNHDVQMLVKEGSVAVDVAVDRVRKEGESAGESLAVDVEKAKAAGKTKVTKSIAQPQFSAKLARRLVELLYDAPAELFAGVNGSEEIQSILQAYREGR
ncbi:chromosome partitioning protein ParB [Biostraticola tofi]|nr:chromosome partitioning protein ParB [Biostraticola tofi]